MSLASRLTLTTTLLALTACPAPADPADTDGTSSGNDTTANSGVTSMSSMTSTDDGQTDTSTSTDDGQTDDSTGMPSFACPPGEGEYQCDLIDQDCPEGFKCILWDARGNLFEPDATVCAPIDSAPVEPFEPCENDIAGCTDNCSATATCFPLGTADEICIDMCDQDAQCPGDQVCHTCGTCPLAWCTPLCDPIAPDCPDPLPGCTYEHAFGQGAFSCGGLPPGPQGPGDSCVMEACGEGLACIEAELLGPGCTDLGCCTEYCDLNNPGFACSDPAHVCIPYQLPGQALPSQEHIGFCALPEADPCLDPGACPPPGIDDTYPWCSQQNDAFCSRGSFGFGDGVACEEGCLCNDDCNDPGDCPVPPTGTATPSCDANNCVLPCGGGEVCPDGMTCSATGGDICMWITPIPPEEC